MFWQTSRTPGFTFCNGSFVSLVELLTERAESGTWPSEAVHNTKLGPRLEYLSRDPLFQIRVSKILPYCDNVNVNPTCLNRQKCYESWVTSKENPRSCYWKPVDVTITLRIRTGSKPQFAFAFFKTI